MENENWRIKTLVLGGIIGAAVGLGAAYLLIQRAEREQSRLQMNAGEGIKLGLLVLGLLRQIAQLGEGS